MSASPIVVARICVVGTIGAGKSSLLVRAKNRPDEFVAALLESPAFEWLGSWPAASTLVVTAPEDTSRWQTSDGLPFLDLMYRDPVLHAFEFQKTVLRERCYASERALREALDTHERRVTHVLLVADGSVETDSGVFAHLCCASGAMSLEQELLYSAFFADQRAQWDNLARVSEAIEYTDRGFIHLVTPTDEAKTRIVKRGRSCEQSLPRDYVELVAATHRELFAKGHHRGRPVVCAVDTPLFEARPFVIMQ